jgi:hypothetical protein
MRETLLSKTGIAQFPVVLDAKVLEGQGETRELSLLSHVDPQSLHLQKEGDHNLDTLTFVFGVFDQKENLVSAQQRHANVDVADGQLPEFLKAGMNVDMDFELKPGSYRIREVVTDSEQRLTALSRNVDIPENIPTTPTASATPPHPLQAPAPQPSSQPNPQLAQPSPTPPRAPPLQAPIQARIRDEETRLYSAAQPYLDDSAPELEKRVRELKGLKPDPSQEQLSSLLLKIGKRVDELVAKVPDLTSDERVTQTEWVVGLAQDCASHSRVPGNFPIENCSQTSGKRIQKDFHYIIQSHQTQDGRVLEEFRTDEQNQPLKSAEGPSFQGFVGSWVIFSPSNRSESRFHYLGEQKIGKREAFVVAFAQIPGSVSVPVMMVNGGGFVPILFQGVAWVDQEDFRIIQLRTDVLAPRQEAGLQKETAKILFGPVDISRLNLELWLPMGVDVRVEANGLAVQEQHAYSNYRLYHATSRMLP